MKYEQYHRYLSHRYFLTVGASVQVPRRGDETAGREWCGRCNAQRAVGDVLFLSAEFGQAEREGARSDSDGYGCMEKLCGAVGASPSVGEGRGDRPHGGTGRLGIKFRDIVN